MRFLSSLPSSPADSLYFFYEGRCHIGWEAARSECVDSDGKFLKACGEALGKMRYCSFAGAVGVASADNSGITAHAAGDNDLALHLSVAIILPFVAFVEEIEDGHDGIIAAMNIDSKALVPLVHCRLHCFRLNLLQRCAKRLPRTPSSSVGNEKIQIAKILSYVLCKCFTVFLRA